MKNELGNILNNNGEKLTDKQLLDYLSNNLSANEQHNVESNVVNDSFADDALEGLQLLNNKEKIAADVEMLNQQLQKQIKKNKQHKLKRKFKDSPFTYAALIIILLLIIVTIAVLKKLQ